MKRSLTTIFLFYLTIIFTYAQTERKEHFSFMNIPINGNINMFAQKLATKGIKVSPTNKVKNLPLARIFEGIWCECNATIIVDYYGINKTVEEVEVLIEGTNRNGLEFKQSSINMDIIKKYRGRLSSRNLEREVNQPLTIYTIYTDTDKKEELGSISTYIDCSEYPYKLWYIYIDEKNSLQQIRQKNNDI